jgi:hypothetical protein
VIIPNDYTQFKGIDGARIKSGDRTEPIPKFPTIGAGELRGYRLEMGRGNDVYSGAIAQNKSRGCGFEIPEGETWFPFWINCSCGYFGSGNYDCDFMGLRLSNWTLKWRGDNGFTNYEKDYLIANNANLAFTADQYPNITFQRVDENVHNMTGTFRNQLYLGMWPSGVTIHHGWKATNAAGISGGVDRVYFELLVHVVRTGQELMSILRDEKTSDKELMRDLTAEAATMFADVSID